MDETGTRLRELLERLEAAGARLEASEAPDDAVDVLQELSELAKEVQATIEQARRAGPRAGADAQP